MVPRPVSPPRGVWVTPRMYRGLDALSAEVESLDTEIAELIRQAIDDGHGPTEIARELGITRARVYQIIGR